MINIMHNSKSTSHPRLHAGNAHSVAVQPGYSIQDNRSLKQLVL